MIAIEAQPLPPAVIVQDRAQVALVAGFGRPVTLLSSPGFASYGGCLWWQAIIEGFDGPALLDCGDAAGRALEALRLGLRGIVLASVPASARIAAIAADCGALLLDTAPPALDLAVRGAERRLVPWLGRDREKG